MRIARVGYFSLLVLLAIFSYGFVDFSLPVSVPFDFNRIMYDSRVSSTIYYVSFVMLLFCGYGYFLWSAHKKKLPVLHVKNILFITTALLLLSYPAFSNDIFNYIATAKVTYLYRENPYIVMPIEFSHEPMLAYLHAANKTALYGPMWILLTIIPHIAGMGSLIQTLVMFKLFITLFYLLTAYLIWSLSNKNILSLIIFALNPLVLIESLVSSHNDMVMMFFALLSFHLLKKRIAIVAFVSLLISIGIKFATIVLIPIFLYVWYRQRSGKKIIWSRIWLSSLLVMTAVFLLSPFREEMYPWYFQWVIVFVSLIPQYTVLLIGMIGLSFGLSFRFAPYVYTRNWGGSVIWLKQLVTGASFILFLASYYAYKFIASKKAR
ncbi:hypothetical protein A3A55_03170 [Candidatus Roizmanbacteria bacterium RIFCSPLOWO2_01_FULL_40_14]|uniref:DUF2029 domain-containing protein n=1 Tax=Candidatus Roizmanbacteria bacterium GW2011_GWC2_41_7 TaxID=1618487 RepID=A0A0G0XDQ0_9BACT|nr:MAG: hypothetical protein UU78_C0005G0005 [Candidatus Roizmanbacteria bacterium GW2011_GWC2_41_7]OGK48704.1 MAG: hypothetical protein A3A55_03170 [Candidatus Roizmanbacteria bacterium RIFCSPLOWO2_01_FULL_40_14]